MDQEVDLDRLDALFAAATEGEWRGDRNDKTVKYWICVGEDGNLTPVVQLSHREDDFGASEQDLECIIALHNSYEDIAAELRTLRARVAELEGRNEMLENEVTQCMGVINTGTYPDLATSGGFYGKLAAKSNTERDRLRAERDAAQDEAAGLREALGKIQAEASVDISGLEGNEGTCICCFCGGSWDSSRQPNHKQECPASIAAASLARTPDQHRARIVAAGLREVAAELKSPAEDGIAIYERMKRSDDALLESGRQTREAEIKDWLLAEAERLEKGAGDE